MLVQINKWLPVWVVREESGPMDSSDVVDDNDDSPHSRFPPSDVENKARIQADAAFASPKSAHSDTKRRKWIIYASLFVGVSGLIIGLAVGLCGNNKSVSNAPPDGNNESSTPPRHTNDGTPPGNVLVNGDFEGGSLDPSWYEFGPVTLGLSATETHSATSRHSVLISDRTAGTWNGMRQDIMGKIKPGIEYQLTAWTKLANSASEQVKMTVFQEDGAGENFIVVSLVTASNADWTEMNGNFTLTVTGALLNLTIYVEGPPIGVDFYLDDAVLEPRQVLTTAAPAPAGLMTTNPPTTVFPPGPYIGAGESEIVVIPESPVPDLGESRRYCPHLQGGLLNWNDPATWGGRVPVSGDVNLPSNTKIIVTQSIVQKLGYLTIPSTSELIFGEDPACIMLDVTGIQVNGVLRAGSETCRLETPLTITLHGARPADITTKPMSPLYKGISVTGTLELHGKRFFKTWTRLAKTASPGDNFLLLQHPVNWETGQKIVLVTTAIKDSREWHQNEVLTVSSVGFPSQVGSIVYLASNVVYPHIANSGYQAEVGLLSRTITVQGAKDDSEPSDPDPLNCIGADNYGDTGAPCPNTELTGYGGHIMVHDAGKGFVEGVELYRMGQTNVLARYPMHFHNLANNCEGCYFRDSSVHRSFYRCVSIHGSHNTTVSENVAFDIIGHCYYLEDGVEEDNTISFNLASLVHIIGIAASGSGQKTSLTYQSPTLTLPADVTASGYYITNMHNNVIGNAASGGWAGFAFPVLYSPTGSHKGLRFRPCNRLAMTIDGNTAHSTGCELLSRI